MPSLTENEITQAAAQFLNARLSSQPYPRISDSHPEWDMACAYQIQRAYVALSTTAPRAAVVAGYKAALTTPATQKSMGIDAPVVGVLYAHGLHHATKAVALHDIPKLLLETELGFSLKIPVSSAIADASQLPALIDSCQPMVELSQLGFGDAPPRGVDLVAANSASRGYIRVPACDWRTLDLNGLQVTLKRDGELLHGIASGSVMEDQWQALRWLINQTVSLGYTIKAGQLLMTGLIGGIHPARPGANLADFGAAGCIAFEIVD